MSTQIGRTCFFPFLSLDRGVPNTVLNQGRQRQTLRTYKLLRRAENKLVKGDKPAISFRVNFCRIKAFSEESTREKFCYPFSLEILEKLLQNLVHFVSPPACMVLSDLLLPKRSGYLHSTLIKCKCPLKSFYPWPFILLSADINFSEGGNHLIF